MSEDERPQSAPQNVQTARQQLRREYVLDRLVSTMMAEAMLSAAEFAAAMARIAQVTGRFAASVEEFSARLRGNRSEATSSRGGKRRGKHREPWGAGTPHGGPCWLLWRT